MKKTKPKWVKTMEDRDFIQWFFMWKEDGEEVLGPTVTVRLYFESTYWDMYVDDSLTNKVPITKHFKTREDALKEARKFIKNHPKGY